MKITDINKTKRGRFSVYIDSEFYGVLHSDIYFISHIKIGEQIDSETLDDLIYRSQIIIAKERALSLLSARSYTRRGLFDKLLCHVDEQAANSVLDRMEELGLIDDKDYAKRYANDCITLKGFSHSRIITALYQKGIDRDTIELTVANLGEENSEKLVLEHIKKRYMNKIEAEDDKRRTVAALQRRGFDYNNIKKVIDNLNEDREYYKDYWEE